MTGTERGASSTCICGHVKAHHGHQPLQQMVRDPRCQWHGCGCPFFISVAEAADIGYEEEEPRVIRVCGCADHPCTCMRSGRSVASTKGHAHG